MKSFLISKKFVNILLLIFLANFLLLPKIVLADNFENITLNEIEKYLQLPANKVEDLIRSLINLFNSEWMKQMSSAYSTAEEMAVPNIMRGVARVQALNHLLIDAPVEVTFGIVKNGVKIAKIFLGQDISELLGQLEKESVQRAIGYGMKVLLENEIRISPGAIKFNYDLQKGGTRETIFQYIMVYKPIDAKRGELVIRFYSTSYLEIPKNEVSWGGTGGLYTELTHDLPPFIVDIQGIVENYQWVGKPSMKIDFPPEVPDLGIRPLSFWERQILKPIIAQVKEVEIIITKVTGKSLGIVEMAVDAWDKIKSNFSKISNFLSGSIGRMPAEKSSPQPSPASETRELGQELLKTEETKSVEESVEKSVEVKPQQARQEERGEQKSEEIIKKEEVEEIKKEEIQKETKKEEAPITVCQKKPGDFSQRNKVIFNEIAWMGTASSANDEWIELKNISGEEIDLTGWQLLDKDSQIKIILDRGLTPVNGFLLLERTNDDSVPGKAADLIYTGGLNNNDEALYFFDKNCQLQDEILANPDWPSGNNSTKRTMERRTDLIWQTSLSPGGTPKRENSSGYVVIVSGGGGVSSNPSAQQETNPQITLSFPSQNPVNKEISVTLSASNLKSATYDVKISILKISEENEQTRTLSEICNENKTNCQSSSYNYLKEIFSDTSFEGKFKLKIKQDKQNFQDEADIFAKIRESGKTSIYAQFSGKINITNPQENPAQNQPPTAFFTFSPKNPVVGDLVSFDAGNSTDTDGIITTYIWDFGDNSTSSGATTSKSYSNAGTSTVRLLVFDDKDATSSTSTIIEILANSPVVPPTYILITEVRAVGTEEFVELYNPTDEATSTAGWYLSYFPADNDWNDPSLNKPFSEAPTTTIPAKSYFLIGFGNYSGAYDWKPYSASTHLKDEAGAIGIFSSNPATTTTSTEAIERAKSFKIDVLGWGNTTVKEGTSVTPTTTEKSFARKIAATSEGVLTYIDSDNNSRDFEIQDPTAKARNQHQFSDLDGDGIIDSYDSTTTITTTIELKAGEYKFKDLAIIQGGKLLLNSSTTLEGFKGVKLIAENLFIDASSSISADGKGYPHSEGLGVGEDSSRAGGGGYGGEGGSTNWAKGGSIYGSLVTPTDLGSGGGTTTLVSGGAGGGAIWIEVTQTLTLNGTTSANGTNGGVNKPLGCDTCVFTDYGGGGSGGSIYITTNVLTGSGLIQVNGGNGGYIDSYSQAGGGGGGRIAIYYQTKGFNGSIEARGGLYDLGGGAGTIYLKSSSQTLGDLILDNGNLAGNVSKLEGNEFTFNNLKILNKAHFILPQNLNANEIEVRNAILESKATSTIFASGDFILSSGSYLIGPAQVFLFINVNGDFTIQGKSKLVGNFEIHNGNLTLDASSSISADGKGYPHSEGLGAGTDGGRAGGGGYGGKGGDTLWTSGGQIYGSTSTPTDLGSGGGDAPLASGGAGGGAIKIEVNQTLTLNGTTSANGTNGGVNKCLTCNIFTDYGGGGSGGSIYITTNVLTGSGLIQANGGKGGYIDPIWWEGGAGGGGRIAVYYQSIEFAGEIQVLGGQGSNESYSGKPGTRNY